MGIRPRELFIPSILFALVLCIFHWNIIFGGKTLLTAYAGARCGYVGEEAAVCDTCASTWVDIPSSYCIHNLLRAGTLPLWNPYNGCGMPLAADLQTGVFTPLKWPFFIWTSSRSWDLFLLGRLFLAGMFTFLFVRSIGLGTVASLVAAVSYMLSGYFACWLNLFHVNVDIFMPLLLLAVEENLRHSGKPYFFFGAIAVALLILGGNPQPAVIALMLATGYCFWRMLTALPGQASRGRYCARKSARYITMVVAGILLSSFALFPFCELLRYSFHAHYNVGLAHDDIASISTILFPSIFDMASIGGMWRIPYLGIIPLLCACCSLGPRCRFRSLALFFALFGLALLLKIYGAPLINQIGELPLLRSILWFRYTAAFFLCAACLAGIGVDAIQRGAVARTNLVICAVLVGVILGVSLYAARDTFSLGVLVNWLLSIKNLASLATVLAAYGMVLWGLRRSMNGGTIAVTLAALLIVELYLYFPAGRARRYEPSHAPAFVRYLQQKAHEEAQPFRVYGVGLLMPPQGSSIFGIQDIRAFSALDVAWYQALMGSLMQYPNLPGPYQPSLIATPRVSIVTSALLNLLNVKYVISAEDISTNVVPNGVPPEGSPGLLLAGTEWGQTFRADHEYLCGLRIRMRTAGRRNRCRVRFHLRRGPGERDDLHTETIDASALRDGEFYQFTFPPQPDSSGKTYYFALTSPDARRGHAVGVYGAKGDRYPFGGAFVNGRVIDGDACFEAAYSMKREIAERYQEVFHDPDCNVTIYENREVMPRVFVVGAATRVRDDREAIERLLAADTALLQRTVLVQKLPDGYNEAPHRDTVRGAATPPVDSRARVIEYRANRVRVEVEMMAPGFLFISDTFYPGWKAIVDGSEHEIIRTDGAFRSVYLPRGKHAVVFAYRPASWYWGMAVSAMALVLMGVFACAGKRDL